jgi:hypothetical protein
LKDAIGDFRRVSPHLDKHYFESYHELHGSQNDRQTIGLRWDCRIGRMFSLMTVAYPINLDRGAMRSMK